MSLTAKCLGRSGLVVSLSSPPFFFFFFNASIELLQIGMGISVAGG